MSSLLEKIEAEPEFVPLAPNENAVKKGMVKWDKDGPAGGRSSIEILVEWLKIPGNFDLYKTDAPGGSQRKKCLIDIVDLLMRENIHHRTQEDVRKKLRDLELAFANTHAKILDLGSLASGSASTFELKSKFNYYHELLPIFKIHYDNQTLGSQNSNSNQHGGKRTINRVPTNSTSTPSNSLSKALIDKLAPTSSLNDLSHPTPQSLPLCSSQMLSLDDPAVRGPDGSKTPLPILELQNSRRLIIEEDRHRIEKRRLEIEEDRQITEKRRLEIEEVRLLIEKESHQKADMLKDLEIQRQQLEIHKLKFEEALLRRKVESEGISWETLFMDPPTTNGN